MKHLSQGTLKRACADASASPRKRKNHNFHRHEEAVQRLLNAIQPDSYVRPHKHEGVEKFEFFVVLQGRAGIVIFEDSGDIKETHVLSVSGPLRGIEIPGETYHSLVGLLPDTVVLEIKEGPYDPVGSKSFLEGFPDELMVLQSPPNSHERLTTQSILEAWQKRCEADALKGK